MKNAKKFSPSRFNREMKAWFDKEKKWIEVHVFIRDNTPSAERRASLLKLLQEKKSG